MAVKQVTSQKTIEQLIEESARKTTNKRNTGELGKDDFLNLLITQLKYQDPLNPVDDKEFIAQMAQFSSLEQMQNINSSVTKSQAFSLIGKHITANVVDSETSESKVVTGEVSNVRLNNGKTYVVVNGQDIPLDQITDVTTRDLAYLPSLAEYTGLIGYDAIGIIYDPKTSDAISIKGFIKAVQMGVYENYAVMDGVEAEISGVITDTGEHYSNPDRIREYLDAHMPPVEDLVTVIITDSSSGKNVPVTARLRSYTETDGKFRLILDDVLAPVDGITKVTSPSRKTDDESFSETDDSVVE